MLTVLPDLFLQRFYVVKPTSSERKEEVVEVRATDLQCLAEELRAWITSFPFLASITRT